jgi:hypothetical protein
LRNDRIEAPCLFDGPINGERFLAYVEQFLVPTLKRNDIRRARQPRIAQRKSGARGRQGRRARLLFLPKYSPDLPIEQVDQARRALPFDTVFVINQSLNAVSRAVVDAGGSPDQVLRSSRPR